MMLFLIRKHFGLHWMQSVERILAKRIGLLFFALALLAILWYAATNIANALEMTERLQHVLTSEITKRVNAEQLAIRCLQGGIVGKAGDEVVTCDGATVFRLKRLER